MALANWTHLARGRHLPRYNGRPFSQAVTAAQARMKSLSTLEADRAAFKAQKDQPGGKKTFYQYIFNLEYDKLRQ